MDFVFVPGDPRVLWQAVTLWLVNRGMAMRRSRPVEQVCNRKGTTWYENYAVRFRQNRVRIESRARDTQPIRGVSVVSDDTAYKGVQKLAPPWLQEIDMGQEEVPYLSICLSIYLSNSQQTGYPFRE